MKNYKVNINRKPLTDEELASGGDFGKLLNTYKTMKPPIYKTVKFWAGSGAIAAVLTTAIVLLMLNKHDVIDANTTPPFINPPVAEANIPTDKFIINTASDTVINYKTGSKLYVPAHAFLDENNNPVQGEVQLNYREFHDVADVFIAGIPMSYDSAGETFHFETAGMMDMGATKEGKNLKVNPSAQIKVDMVSNNTDDSFNTYYLDTANKRWVYQTQSNYMAALPAPSSPAKPNMESASINETQSEASKQLAEVKEQLKEATLKQDAPAVKPVEPVKIDKAKPRFSIKVDEKEFPELASYNGVKFQVVNEKEYLPEKANTEWEEVDLKKIEGTPNYKITFSNSKEKFTVTATPAFAEKDYAEAKKVYDEKYKQYQAGLTNRKADEERKRNELAARAKELEEQMRLEIAEQKKRIHEYEKNMAQTQLFYRTFSVARFGTWNCDHPQAYPQGAVVAANFTDENGKKLNLSTIYLIEKGRNAMFSYGQGQVTRLSFNPGKENFIWAITNENKMCVIPAEKFKEAAKLSGSVDFKMEVIDRQFSSSDEVKQYLKI